MHDATGRPQDISADPPPPGASPSTVPLDPQFDEIARLRHELERTQAERKHYEEDISYILAGAQCLLWHAEVVYLGEHEPLDWHLTFTNEETAYRFLSLETEEGQSFATAWHVSRPESDRNQTDAYARQEILAGRNYRQQFRYQRADRKIAWIAEDVHVETVAEGHWRLVGVCTDITTLKQREREVEALNHRLLAAMMETHHRVKNNLQLLSATIDLSKTEDGDLVPATSLERLRMQIHTLGAIHDILTEAVRGEQRGTVLHAQPMLERLLSMLEATTGASPILREIEDAALTGRQTTSLALIVQELVMNALKHGKGGVSVRFTQHEGWAALVVEDDGPGFPEGFDPVQASSTGLELILILARHDLEAIPHFEKSPVGGGSVRIEIPLVPIAEISTRHAGSI